MTSNSFARLVYITHYAHIPTSDADSVCVMHTCAEFADEGISVDLIIPDLHASYSLKESEINNVWRYYSVSNNFIINILSAKLLYALGFIGRTIYKLYSIYFSLTRKPHVIFTRQIEIAWVTALSGKFTILSEHVVSKISGRLLFPHFLKMLKNSKRPVGMITVTNSAKEYLIGKGVPAERILVAPMAVDLSNYPDRSDTASIRKSLNLPLEKTIVGFSGSLHVGRGVEELIEAAKSHPSIVFLIVGGNKKDIQRCQEFAKSLAVTNVEFVGFVPPKDVPNYILASDILVMPYTSNTTNRTDMSPMKMFEYLAAQKPIIATDFPVIREILTHKKNAVLIRPDSSKEIVQAIHWVLDNPKECKNMTKQARIIAEEHTWKNRSLSIISWIHNNFGEHLPHG